MEKKRVQAKETYTVYQWPDGTIEITWDSTSARKRRCGVLFTSEGIDFFVSDQEPEIAYASGRLDEHDVLQLLDKIEQVINGEEDYDALVS